MRYRKLTVDGDYSFGQGQLNFLIDSPAAVAQAVQTSLLLWLGEWYLDVNAGVPYLQGVIGKHSKETSDNTILAQIGLVQGVVNIENFTSVVDPVTRKYTAIGGMLNTIYGKTKLEMQNIGNF